MQLSSFKLTLIQDGLFSLPVDAFSQTGSQKQSRLLVGMNCLLVQGRGQTVLIDTGVGQKQRRNFVESYRMEWPRRLYRELEAMNVRRDDIDVVILTHLHWDHTGGATVLDESGTLRPAFPRARYFLQRKEWEEAIVAPSDDEGYLREDFVPLHNAGVLELLDGDSKISPGIEVRLTGGHSSGHQIVLIGDSDGTRAVFLADLIPTASLLSLQAAMTFDTEHEILAREKSKILEEAAQEHWLLIFQHAPKQRAGYLISPEGPIDWVNL